GNPRALYERGLSAEEEQGRLTSPPRAPGRAPLPVTHRIDDEIVPPAGRFCGRRSRYFTPFQATVSAPSEHRTGPYVSRRTRVEPFAEAGRHTVNLGGRYELVDLHRRPRHPPQDRRRRPCRRAADLGGRHLRAPTQPRHGHHDRAGSERDPRRRPRGDDRPRRADDPLTSYFLGTFPPDAPHLRR